jgi:Fe-S cluster assembly ATPase SufC
MSIDKEKGVTETQGRVVPAGGDDVAHRLEEMGYKQELKRNLGMVAVLGLSFAIMAVSTA